MAETINIEKYIEALNNLLGSDNAYYAGDPDVDAIVEVIMVAKKLGKRVKKLTEENEGLKAEIKDLEEEYDRVYEQAEADIYGNIADGGTSCHWCMDKTRGDTVRKMQKKLGEKITLVLDKGFKYKSDATINTAQSIMGYLDKIAKEMLEDRN